MCLAQGPQRSDAQTCSPRSWVEHSTTESLRSSTKAGGGGGGGGGPNANFYRNPYNLWLGGRPLWICTWGLAKIHGACHKWLVSELFHTISGLRQTFFRFLSNWLLTIDKRKKDKIPPMVASWTHNCMVTQLSPTSSESFLGLCVLYKGHFFDVLWEPLLSLQKEIDSPTSNFKQEGSYHARVIWYETTIRAKAISHIRNWTKRIDFFTFIHSI